MNLYQRWVKSSVTYHCAQKGKVPFNFGSKRVSVRQNVGAIVCLADQSRGPGQVKERSGGRPGGNARGRPGGNGRVELEVGPGEIRGLIYYD